MSGSDENHSDKTTTYASSTSPSKTVIFRMNNNETRKECENTYRVRMDCEWIANRMRIEYEWKANIIQIHIHVCTNLVVLVYKVVLPSKL